MKKTSILIIALFGFLIKSEGQIYMADSCRVSFFSAATIENLAAVNTTSKPIMNAATGDIQMSITNLNFIFHKELMQEHFNEDYMESNKYPHIVFKGKINEKVDYTKDGENKVTVTGTMDLHGVQKPVTIPGTLTVKNGVLFLSSKFDVKLADYNIKIPALLGNNIAESEAITFTACMKPYKTK